jgi:hypothetical protein
MDTMTVNYNTWTVTFYIWTTFFLVGGLKFGRTWWFVACGIMMTFTALCKRQGATLFPLIIAVLWLAPYLSLPQDWAKPERRRRLVAYRGESCRLRCSSGSSTRVSMTSPAARQPMRKREAPARRPD